MLYSFYKTSMVQLKTVRGSGFGNHPTKLKLIESFNETVRIMLEPDHGLLLLLIVFLGPLLLLCGGWSRFLNICSADNLV